MPASVQKNAIHGHHALMLIIGGSVTVFILAVVAVIVVALYFVHSEPFKFKPPYQPFQDSESEIFLVKAKKTDSILFNNTELTSILRILNGNDGTKHIIATFTQVSAADPALFSWAFLGYVMGGISTYPGGKNTADTIRYMSGGYIIYGKKPKIEEANLLPGYSILASSTDKWSLYSGV
jgi:hypothetical protein